MSHDSQPHNIQQYHNSSCGDACVVKFDEMSQKHDVRLRVQSRPEGYVNGYEVNSQGQMEAVTAV